MLIQVPQTTEEAAKDMPRDQYWRSEARTSRWHAQEQARRQAEQAKDTQ